MLSSHWIRDNTRETTRNEVHRTDRNTTGTVSHFRHISRTWKFKLLVCSVPLVSTDCQPSYFPALCHPAVTPRTLCWRSSRRTGRDVGGCSWTALDLWRTVRVPNSSKWKKGNQVCGLVATHHRCRDDSGKAVRRKPGRSKEKAKDTCWEHRTCGGTRVEWSRGCVQHPGNCAVAGV